MANSTAVKLFRTDLGDDAQVLASAIDAWLVAQGRIDLFSVAVLRRTLQNRANDLTVALSYARVDPLETFTTGLALRARAFVATSTEQSSEGSVAAFFAIPTNAGTQLPVFVVDVSERAIAAGFNTAYIAFYFNFAGQRTYGRANATFFAKPAVDLAPLSNGLCDIYDAFGANCGRFTVRNVSDAYVWTRGQVNYIVRDSLTGRWIGAAPCQVANPAAAPSPSYQAGPFPRVDGATPAEQSEMTVAVKALPYTPVP
jgi:hypothetical protein